MKIKKIGTITLALTLISLGLIFLLNNFLNINIIQILSIVWPSIIILLGLEIVIFNLFYKKNGDDKIFKIDGISVTFLIFIIIITSVASNINVQINGVNFIPDFMIEYKQNSEFNKEFTIEGKDKEELILNNSHGDVSIMEDNIDDIEVQIEIFIRHNDKDYAKYISDNIININTKKEKTIEITTEKDIFINDWKKVKSISVNYFIRIPKGLEVNIKNEFGDIKVDNIKGPISITNRHGDVLVQYLEEDLYVKNSYGKINIQHIDGNVGVESNHGDVFVEKIKGLLDINNTYGAVKVNNIGNKTKIKNIHNSVEAANIQGDLFINTRHGEINVQNVKGNIEMNGSYKPITIDRVEGNVVTRNLHGDIILLEASKHIDLISKHGDIRVETKNTISDDVRLENEYGNIKLVIPDKQQGIFEIYNKYGNIYNELDFKVTKDINESMINEKIGESENKFYLRTKNGNIEINTN